MDTTTLTIIAIILYFLILIYMGYKDNKTNNSDDFIIGDRNIGSISTASSIAASFRDGGGTAFWIGAGFAYGYGYTTFVFGFILGLVLLAYISPSIRADAIKNNYITVGQMIKSKIGERTAKALSFLVIILAGLGVSVQLYILGNTLSTILNIPLIVSSFSVAFVVCIYLLLGGYKTIIKTDMFQLLIILALGFCLFFIPLESKDLLNFKSFDIKKEVSAIFFIWGFAISFTNADRYQRIFSAKSTKSVKLGVFLAGPLIALITFILVAFGLSGTHFLSPELTSNNVLFELIGANSVFNPWIIVLLILAIIAMTMSTLDTFTYLFSSTLLEDFVKVEITKNKKRYIRLSRICMVSLLIIGSVISLFIKDFMEYFLAVSSYSLIFGPVIVLVALNILEKSKRNDIVLTFILAISTSVFVYLVVTGLINILSYKLLPFGVCVSLVIISALVFRKKGK